MHQPLNESERPSISTVEERIHRLLINGQWHEAGNGERFPVFNPATGEVIAEAAAAGAADFDAAAQMAGMVTANSLQGDHAIQTGLAAFSPKACSGDHVACRPP
jgi:hypothetical protein